MSSSRAPCVLATPQQVHRLVYAGLIEGRDKIERAFQQADPRHDVEVWRAFARFTLLPLGVSLVVIALSLALSATHGNEAKEHAAATAFFFGACAAAVVALVNAGKRALVPIVVGVVVGSGLMALGHEARILYDEDDYVAALALGLFAIVGWALLRAASASTPHEIEVDSDDHAARISAFLAPASTGRTIACVALWVIGAPVALASFVAFMDERDLGAIQLGVGFVLFVVGGVITRRQRRLIVARHAGLLAFITGTLYMCGSLMEHLRIVDRDERPLLALPVLVVGWLLVRSWPVRAAWGALIAFIVLMWMGGASPSGVEAADDVVLVLCAALATFLLLRGARSRYVRPVLVAVGFMVLVFTLVEVPEIAADTRLNIGTASSIGAMFCMLAAALVVLRGASTAAKALVCAVLFLACALYIDAPGVVVAALVLLLARQARSPSLELFAFVAMLAGGWAIVQRPWGDIEEHAIKAALTAVVLLAVGLTLRRVPLPLSSQDGTPSA